MMPWIFRPISSRLDENMKKEEIPPQLKPTMSFYIKNKKQSNDVKCKEFQKVLEMLDSEEQLEERIQLHDALMKAHPDKALKAVFAKTFMSDLAVQCHLKSLRASLSVLFQRFNTIRVIPIGSMATGCAMRNADVDLLVETHDLDFSSYYEIYRYHYGYENMLSISLLERLEELLMITEDFREVTFVDQICGSLVSCVHVATGHKINFHTFRPSSADVTNIFKTLIKQDSRIHDLYCFLKIWSKQLQLNIKAELSSHILLIMVIFYLQQPLNVFRSVAPLPPLRLINYSTINYDKRIAEKTQFNKIIPKMKLSTTLTIPQLIKGFFSFYKHFDYDGCMISTYFGKAMNRSEFADGKFYLMEFMIHLNRLSHMLGYFPKPMRVDSEICVQDIIYLNCNIGYKMKKAYLCESIKNAHAFLKHCSNLPPVTIYENLLFGHRTAILSVDLGKRFYDTSDNIIIECKVNSSEFDFISRRCTPNAIKRAKQQNLSKIWINCYTQAFENILKQIFCMSVADDVEKLRQIQRIYGENIRKSWRVKGYVNLASDICNANVTQDYLTTQISLYRDLYGKRKNDPVFNVQFEGRVALTVQPDYKSFHLMLYRSDFSSALDMRPTNPLRSMFYMLKCIMYKLTIKQAVQVFNIIFRTEIPKSLPSSYIKKSQKSEKSENSEKSKKSEESKKSTKSGKSGKSEKSEKSKKSGESEKSEKSRKSNKSRKSGKSKVPQYLQMPEL